MQSVMVGKEQVLPPPSLTVLVAVNGSMRSARAVMWALEKFSKKRILFRLLHVCPVIKAVPTAMGNFIPISRVRPDVVAAYKEEIGWEINKMLLSYGRLDPKRKVEMEVMVIESDDVPQAIAGVVSMSKISKLVIGSSSHCWFASIFKGKNLSSRISKCIPSFCSVYVVSKGKVTVHHSTSEADGNTKNRSNGASSSAKTGSSFYPSSQTGTTPRFQPLSSIIIKDNPFSKSRSTGNGHSLSALMEITDRMGVMHSSSNNLDVPYVGSRIYSSRSLRADWRMCNSDQGSDASPISSNSTPGTRVKETKH